MNKPDCNTCGWADGEDCAIPGWAVCKQSDANTMRKTQRWDGTIYERPRCNQHTTPDAAQIIRAHGVMRCADCVHCEVVREVELCFGDPEMDVVTSPYPGVGTDRFSRQKHAVKAEADGLGFKVCVRYEQENRQV